MGTWRPHGNTNQMWKKVGDTFVSKWNNYRLGFYEPYGLAIFKGEGDIPKITVDETGNSEYIPKFEGTH